MHTYSIINFIKLDELNGMITYTRYQKANIV